jgi:Zn-finger nucleic acid-binding protein
LIWLDYGEITKVVNAPGRDRGVPRKKPAEHEEEKKREKKRSVIDQSFIDLLGSFLNKN